ncbi:hypothetical protein Tco_1117420, partial [Tanacetum coccineum]
DPSPPGESLSGAWTHFKDLLQKVPHHGIDLWLQVEIFYDHVNPAIRRTIDQAAGDFAKPVKAISLPQDVPSTSDRHLIELENLVHARSVVFPTTLNIAWKIPSKLLLITHPRVPKKRKASGTLSNPSKTTLLLSPSSTKRVAVLFEDLLSELWYCSSELSK